MLSHLFSSIKNFIAPLPYDKGHDSCAIANIFIQKYLQDERDVSLMPLVKLIYIAHGWKLGMAGKPLIADRVEPALYGPNVPRAYDILRKEVPVGSYVSNLAKNWRGNTFTAQLSKDEQEIVDNVYKNYSFLSIDELINITAAGDDKPWGKSYVKKPYGTISNKSIQRYYEECVDRQQGSVS